jgi:uncharacterized membrane protein
MNAIRLMTLALCLVFTYLPADAKGGKGSGPHYGGGKHASGHGGSYKGGNGSSHKGGSYKNGKTDDQYGKHK